MCGCNGRCSGGAAHKRLRPYGRLSLGRRGRETWQKDIEEPEIKTSYEYVLNLLKNSLVSKLTSLPAGLGDRLMTFKLPLHGKKTATVISAYVPTMRNHNDIKEKFHQDLNSLTTSVPKPDKLIFKGRHRPPDLGRAALGGVTVTASSSCSTVLNMDSSSPTPLPASLLVTGHHDASLL
ncbi:hypothetical protein ElyMa_006939500 [Elysia marginata]|uniref:Uncharacterized protein n=1 Tax=Elysia marginata TaxID=1093978 RepID=A0AAV4JGV1_9GAST|nr:hypothetical protein ElyMa_006939500 [Elysia marginata]